MGFNQFANRWIPSGDLRCGHKLREYMRENTVDSLAVSRERILEQRSIREAKEHMDGIKARKPHAAKKLKALVCDSKPRSTSSSRSDADPTAAESCPAKRRRLDRKCFGYPSWHLRKRAHRTCHTKPLPTLSTTSTVTRVNCRSSLGIKQSRSRSSLSCSEDTSFQASEVKTSSLLLSRTSLSSVRNAASLPAQLPRSSNRQMNNCSKSGLQKPPLGLCSSAESDVNELSLSESSNSNPPSPNRGSEAYFPSGARRSATETARPPVRCRSKRKDHSTAKIPGLPPVKYHQSMTASYSVTKVRKKQIQPTVEYSSKRNSYSSALTLRKSQRLQMRRSLVQDEAQSTSCSIKSTSCSIQSTSCSIQSTSCSINDSTESESGRDSVSDVDSFPSSPRHSSDVCPLCVGSEIERNQVSSLSVWRRPEAESNTIRSGRRNGKVLKSPLAQASNNTASPVSLPLCSSSDLCIIAVPVNVNTGPEPDNPTSNDSFTMENRHSVISHSEYMIFSQNVVQVSPNGVGEVTIPPASVGVSSDTNGGNLSRDRNSQQPVASSTLSSSSTTKGVSVRMQVVEKNRQRNGILLHRDVLPISRNTVSHLTCIGDILRSKRTVAYTPSKSINPLYQMLLDAWELSIYQVTAGKEGYVYIENSVDESLPPLDVHYITERVYSKNVPPRVPRNATEICNCREDCLSHSTQCRCTTDLTAMPAYFRNGKAKANTNLPIAECWTSCVCGPQCSNRVVQHGRRDPLCIFRTTNRGWGVKAVVHIPRGTFLATYVGEVISDDEAEERGMDITSQGLTYLFDLDYCKDQTTSVFTVDATNCGNVARFFNHSVSIFH